MCSTFNMDYGPWERITRFFVHDPAGQFYVFRLRLRMARPQDGHKQC